MQFIDSLHPDHSGLLGSFADLLHELRAEVLNAHDLVLDTDSARLQH